MHFVIPARDGFELAATVFRPPATRSVDRAVAIFSAMGVSRAYYYPFSEFLSERGCAVVCFDYRGIGDSAPARLRGFSARLSDWGRLDAAGVVDWIRAAFPHAPLRVVGHSVGGQLLGLLPNYHEIGGGLFVAAQSGYWGHWSGLYRLRVMLLWFLLIPLLPPALGYFPAHLFGLGRDLPRGVAREWARWGRHPDYMLGRLTEPEAEGYRCFAGRLRAIGFGDDPLAPPRAVSALVDCYPTAAREQREIIPQELGLESIGHFGFFRERLGPSLWPGECDWLLD